MSQKGADAFRTIGEVADELDLPQHVLRFWETKFSQIRPMKRSSGRRFYRPEDVALVRVIRDLLYGQGYTIRGVQKLLKEHGARGMVGASALQSTEEPQPDLAPAATAPPALLHAAAPDQVDAAIAEQDASPRASAPAPSASGALRDELHALRAALQDCERVLREAREG